MHKRAHSCLALALGIVAALYPLTTSASALWFGDKGGLHQIDTSTNHVAIDVTLEPPVAVAVNSADGSVWALTQSRLLRLSSQGIVKFEVSLRDLGNGLGAPRLLALNPSDSSIWAGFENRVLHFDGNGALRQTISSAPADLTVSQDGSLWILSQASLEQRDIAGASARVVPLTGPAKGSKRLALDDTGGAIWLAGDKDIVRLSLAAPDHISTALVAPETVSAISIDIQSGDLWLLGQHGLFAFTRGGVPRVSRDLRDFSISNPQTLVFDFASQAAWVGHQQGLSRIGTSGSLDAAFAADARVVAVAIGKVPLNITPVVSIVSPATGALVTTATPLLRIAYDALCGSVSCGFPKSFFSTFTPSVLLNGTEVGSSFVFDATTGGATFTPGSRLPEGLNSWTAQVRDPFGKTSDTVSASFTIDSIAPAFGNVTPANGSSLATPSITISGSVDDPSATVTLGGQTQGPSFNFPIILSSGSNTLTLFARDPAGNTATLQLTYIFNLPPTVRITAPADHANFEAPASFTVTADASDTDGTIASVEFFKDGASIGIDTVAGYSASASALPLGTYVFTAKATDNRGATAMSAPITVTVGPPNALPSVRIKSPVSNTAYSAPATVHVVAEASDTDGTISKVDFFRDNIPAGTAMTFPFAATITGIPPGPHTLTARATDDRGGATTTPATTITVAATSISITIPAPNAAIAGTAVLVQGRIQALPNTGVLVNNQAATVDAFGNFYANVPLNAGANTIVAALNAIDGAVQTASISVTATGVPSPYIVAVNPAAGLAPLPVKFSIINPTSSDVTVSSALFGSFLLPAGASATVPVTYPAGVWVTTIVFGGTFTHQLLVDSRDPAQMDQMFRAIWDGMNRALVAGDKEGAMRYLNGGAQRKFGPVFDALMPFMAQIVASYSTLAQSSITNGIGEYAVTRMDGGIKRIYLIYFTQGADGVWRIDEM